VGPDQGAGERVMVHILSLGHSNAEGGRATGMPWFQPSALTKPIYQWASASLIDEPLLHLS